MRPSPSRRRPGAGARRRRSSPKLSAMPRSSAIVSPASGRERQRAAHDPDRRPAVVQRLAQHERDRARVGRDARDDDRLALAVGLAQLARGPCVAATGGALARRRRASPGRGRCPAAPCRSAPNSSTRAARPALEADEIRASRGDRGRRSRAGQRAEVERARCRASWRIASSRSAAIRCSSGGDERERRRRRASRRSSRRAPGRASSAGPSGRAGPPLTRRACGSPRRARSRSRRVAAGRGELLAHVVDVDVDRRAGRGSASSPNIARRSSRRSSSRPSASQQRPQDLELRVASGRGRCRRRSRPARRVDDDRAVAEQLAAALGRADAAQRRPAPGCAARRRRRASSRSRRRPPRAPARRPPRRRARSGRGRGGLRRRRAGGGRPRCRPGRGRAPRSRSRGRTRAGERVERVAGRPRPARRRGRRRRAPRP